MIKATIYTIRYIDQDNNKRIQTHIKTVTEIKNKNENESATKICLDSLKGFSSSDV